MCCRIHVRHGNRFAILRRSFLHVYDARISVLRARQGAFRVHRRISLRRFIRRLLGDFSRSGGTLIHYALHGFLTRMLHRRFPHVFQRRFRDLLLRFKFRNRLFVFFDHLHFPGHVVNRLLHHTVQLRVGGVLQELRVNVLHVLPRRVLFGHCAGKVFRRCTHVFLRLLQGHFVGFHAVQRTVGDHLAHRVRNRVFRNPLRNVRAHRFCNLSAFGDKAVQRFGSNVSFRELTNLRRRAFRTGKRAVCNRPDGFRKVRSMLRRRVDYLLHCKHSLAAAHFVHKRLPGRARRFHVHSAELHHARNGGRLACIAALQRLGQRSQFLICRHVEIYGVLLRSRAGFRVRNRVIIIGCIFIRNAFRAAFSGNRACNSGSRHRDRAAHCAGNSRIADLRHKIIRRLAGRFLFGHAFGHVLSNRLIAFRKFAHNQVVAHAFDQLVQPFADAFGCNVFQYVRHELLRCCRVRTLERINDVVHRQEFRTAFRCQCHAAVKQRLRIGRAAQLCVHHCAAGRFRAHRKHAGNRAAHSHCAGKQAVAAARQRVVADVRNLRADTVRSERFVNFALHRAARGGNEHVCRKCAVIRIDFFSAQPLNHAVNRTGNLKRGRSNTHKS